MMAGDPPLRSCLRHNDAVPMSLAIKLFFCMILMLKGTVLLHFSLKHNNKAR